MEMNLCDWCGQPALEDSELCQKCSDAQKDVEQGRVLPAYPIKKERTALQTTGHIALEIVKAMTALVLGAIMVAAGIFGTCTSIFATLGMSLPGIAIAAIALGTAYLMFRLIRLMYQTPPREITPPPPPPSSITETIDDEHLQ